MKHFKAKDIMTRDVFTVRPETTVKEVAHFFLEKKISGAPVVDAAGKLVGIVTEDDLIFRDANVHLPTVVTIFDSIIYLENPHKYEHELQKVIGGKVEDIMTRALVTISPETDLQEMATLMHEQKRHLLPVLEGGALVGIVGKADLVRAIAQEE
ncbi:CBS domain-containing protein [candidate division FCPU426 bacterium]|nr:CBS domain-containing protein [candidate division FCPU426 bacterium]